MHRITKSCAIYDTFFPNLDCRRRFPWRISRIGRKGQIKVSNMFIYIILFKPIIYNVFILVKSFNFMKI